MIPEMQMTTVIPRSKIWVHALAAFQLQCGFQDQKKTSGIPTQQLCQEDDCPQTYSRMRKATVGCCTYIS